MLKSIIKGSLRRTLKRVFGPDVPIARQRRIVNRVAVMMPAPGGVRRKALDMNGVRGDLMTAGKQRAKRAILYVHGGGYCIGSPYSYRVVTGTLAKRAGMPVYAPDYRLAPEHPHPAALDDALTAWRWLLAEGFLPKNIALAGDSAGAGLALALCLALRNKHERLPAAIALISPWVDLAGRGDTFTERADRDPMLSPAGLTRWAKEYLGDLPADHPACSPLYAELRGLPPMLIQVGSEEIAHSDATRLALRAQQAGVDVTLREFEGLWHDFHLHAGLLRESGDALEEIADFIVQRVSVNPTETGGHAALRQ
jgi:epsilon-lactone hydrolase